MEMGDEFQDIANPGGGLALVNMPIVHHRHTPVSPLSHQEEDLSDPDLQDEESGEELPQQPLQGSSHSASDVATTSTNVPNSLVHFNSIMNASQSSPFLMKYKAENNADILSQKNSLETLQAVIASGGFNLPLSLMPNTFLPPQHLGQNSHPPQVGSMGPTAASTSVAATTNQINSSASSHSSESSQSSARNGTESRETSNHSQINAPMASNHQQQTNWSFEEQFKQVRQLYEINDDPRRKEFLDELFSFMQKRGTPINRLPIMAKSVLDLYELYNLVIARGGLVDVINKKLWQEIIKGLHLPSSITSAAFTLRTQYMKYLYPYECEKRHLSTPVELQAAIDGNRREGRRNSYGPAFTANIAAGESIVQRSVQNSLGIHTSIPLLSSAAQHHNVQALVNGGAAVHTSLPHHLHHATHPSIPLGQSGSCASTVFQALTNAEMEVRMMDFMHRAIISKDFQNRPNTPSSPMLNHHGNASPPSSTPSGDGGAFNISRSPIPIISSPEPQREALDLGLRSTPVSASPTGQSPTPITSNQMKREINYAGPSSDMPKVSLKRQISEDDSPLDVSANNGTHIKISSRGDRRSGDNSLVVTMEINGIMYQGVLFAQREGATSNNTKNTPLVL